MWYNTCLTMLGISVGSCKILESDKDWIKCKRWESMLREENRIWGEFFVRQAIILAFLHVKCCYSHFTDERNTVQRGTTVWKECTQIYAYRYAPSMWRKLALIQVFQILKPNLHLLYCIAPHFQGVVLYTSSLKY